jgi:hypothetical protein
VIFNLPKLSKNQMIGKALFSWAILSVFEIFQKELRFIHRILNIAQFDILIYENEFY